ncbi:MAG: hypothetical protein M5U23_06550 [Acidimicrobiia bacterium]|nr:hypothetical protein [Acidimicrobiia bacterium]
MKTPIEQGKEGGHSFRVLAPLMLAIVLVAAACSSTSGTTAATSQTGGSPATTAPGGPDTLVATTSPDASAGTDSSGTTSTLAADVAALGKGCSVDLSAAAKNNARGQEEFGLTEETIIARVDAVESLIACCATNAGFEYSPVDYATVRKAMDANSKPSGLTGDEFRAQFGYGITTLYAGADSQAVIGMGQQNIRYRDSLSPTDRVAFERTLFGDNPEATFAVSLDDENFAATGGCTKFAVAQVFTPDQLGASFVNYQNAAGVSIDQDPRIIAAYKDWAACMRADGYSYNNTSEIDADLATRLNAITGGVDPATLSSEAQAALKQLQGEEIAIAAADKKCAVQYVDDIQLKVEAELLGPDANQ